ncbi:MAG TPA: type II secretion system minor pseudopilin GspK [Steroidobacteraceae bacterium]|nr:type II secretion system minor pseudopilin GspK [Steroidobacteraceae bacterium]
MTRAAGGCAPARERGIALLTAILLVALGTMLAAALGYETAMTARRSQGVFAFDQSILIAEAGEALAAYALQQSRALNPQSDAPGQPWAMPYGPVEVTPGITLEASLEDMQGRFNINNLVDENGQIDANALQAFENLLQILGLETKWGPQIADWIDADNVAYGPDGAEDATYLAQMPPYRTANRQITSPSELLALPGFGPVRYARIEPYVAALPRGTKVNVCTASGAVLDALAPTGERQYSGLDPQTFAMQRADGCFPTVTEYQAAFKSAPGAATSLAMTAVSQQSDYFRLRSIVDIGSAEFYLYSLLHRERDRMHVIERSFTAD